MRDGCDEHIIGKFPGPKDPRSTERYARLLTENLKGVWQRRPQSAYKPLRTKANVLKFKKNNNKGVGSNPTRRCLG